jgi:hypothetical protein
VELDVVESARVELPAQARRVRDELVGALEREQRVPQLVAAIARVRVDAGEHAACVVDVHPSSE